MDTKIVFNGRQFTNTVDLTKEIKLLKPEEQKFSGSLVYDSGLSMFLFNSVNYEKIEYYIKEINNINKTSEVEFEFQTDDEKAGSL